MQQTPKAQPADRPRRRGRWRRVIGLAILALLLLLGVIQGVLWSNIPRNMLNRDLDRMLGMDVDVRVLSVGWFGNTTAQSLQVTLPLGEGPILTAPRVRVRHTALPWLLLGYGIELKSIELTDPLITVRQRPDGSWNVMEAWESLTLPDAAGGSAEPQRVLELPDLTLLRGRLDLLPLNGSPMRLDRVAFEGRTARNLSYEFRADVPGLLETHGRLARIAPWSHELTFKAGAVGELLTMFTGVPLKPLGAGGRWRGRAEAGALTGRLHLEHAEHALVEMTGMTGVTLAWAGPTLTLEPESLKVELKHDPVRPLTLAGGRAVFSGDTLTTQRLLVRGYDGDAQVTSSINLVDQSGQVEMEWEDVVWPTGFRHGGDLRAELKGADRFGPMRLQVTAETIGVSRLIDWRADLVLDASGPSWADLVAQLQVNELRLSRGQAAYRPPDLSTRIRLDDQALTVSQLSPTGSDSDLRLSGGGAFDFGSGVWSASFLCEQFQMAGVPEPISALVVEAQGNPERVDLSRAELQAANLDLAMVGSLVYERPEPLEIDVTLRQAALPEGPIEQLSFDARRLSGQLKVYGTVQPLALRSEGELKALDFRFGGEPIGDVNLRVAGDVDETRAELSAAAVEWLGSQWSLRTDYTFADQSWRFYAEAAGLDLSLAKTLFDVAPGLRGRVDLSLVAATRGWSIHNGSLRGAMKIADFSVGHFHADAIEAQLRSPAGSDDLEITDLVATRGDGKAVGALAFDTSQLGRINVDLQIDDWPLELVPGDTLGCLVNGRVVTDGDLARRQGQGRARVSFTLRHGENNLGELRAAARLDGSILTIGRVGGDVLDAHIDGSARINLEHPEFSVADLVWENLRLSGFETYAALLGETRGTVSGRIRLDRTEDPQALSPVQITLSMTGQDAAFRTIDFTSATAIGYLEPHRFILSDCDVQAAGGELDLWGRYSTQTDGGVLYVNLTADDVGIAKLISAANPDNPEPSVGLLDGNAVLILHAQRPRDFLCTGGFDLHDSDLATVPIFTRLFSLLRLDLTSRPQGSGSAKFHIDGGRFTADQIRYQNRGAQVLMEFSLEDIYQGRDSPLNGFAIVTLTPLPNFDFFATINELFRAFQVDANPYVIAGTFEDPTVRKVPFQELTNSIRNFFGRQLQTN